MVLWGPKHVGVLWNFLAFAKAMLDVLPEDGPMGTETCRSFMEFV